MSLKKTHHLTLPCRICFLIIAILSAVFLWNAGGRSLQENLFYLTLLGFLPLFRIIDLVLARDPLKSWAKAALPPRLVETLPMNVASAIIFALLLSEKGDTAVQVVVTWMVGVPFLLSMMIGFNMITLRFSRRC